VISDGQESPFREDKYTPPYDTDPRVHNLPVFNRAIPDLEFEQDYRSSVRAFPNLSDAFEFAGHCNLVNLRLLVFDRVNDEWIYNSGEVEKAIEQLI